MDLAWTQLSYESLVYLAVLNSNYNSFPVDLFARTGSTKTHVKRNQPN